MTTQVIFRELSMRQEGDSWVVGRPDTGDFVLVPEIAHRAITLLSATCTVEETTLRLRVETGRDIAVADFVASLDELGFVAVIDGNARPATEVPRPTLPWLRQRHLSWLLSPAVPWLAAAVIVAGMIVLVREPRLTPRFGDLAWTSHAGLALAVDAAVGWLLVGLHELAHLATARAAGVPAQTRLATRLQFLAVETDVSGVWAAPRRVRVTAYLAGMCTELIIAAGCLLILGIAHPHGLAGQLLSITLAESVLFLPSQLLVFMRTDVYFLLQDLAGCTNLYADGSAYVRDLARRAIGRGDPPGREPGPDLPDRERWAVRCYAWLLLVGTIACLADAVFLAVPATVALLVRGATELDRGAIDMLDGLAALSVLGSIEVLWLYAWWRRHGGQLRGCLRNWQRAMRGGDKHAAG
jgi:putative peptide zinc metalloprotease protein